MTLAQLPPYTLLQADLHLSSGQLHAKSLLIGAVSPDDCSEGTLRFGAQNGGKVWGWPSSWRRQPMMAVTPGQLGTSPPRQSWLAHPRPVTLHTGKKAA